MGFDVKEFIFFLSKIVVAACFALFCNALGAEAPLAVVIWLATMIFLIRTVELGPNGGVRLRKD